MNNRKSLSKRDAIVSREHLALIGNIFNSSLAHRPPYNSIVAPMHIFQSVELNNHVAKMQMI